MAEPLSQLPAGESALRAEIARQQKVIEALVKHAERSASGRGSEFYQFQTTVLLDDQVRHRTRALEAALHENEKITRALRESDARFRGVVNQPLVGIVIVEEGRFIYANPKFGELFGYSTDELRALGPLDVVVPDDRPRVAEALRQRMAGEVARVEYVLRGLRKDGSLVDLQVYGGTMDLDGKRVLISFAMDITERVRIEREVQCLNERLREQSLHDALTGLYNRHYMEEALARELTLVQRRPHPVSLIMGDLDHFKAVNDRHGHLAGDEVLRTFGALMMRHARGSDIYCRYGGEEFLLVLPGMTEDAARARAEHLRAQIEAALITFGGTGIAVTASFGVATAPGHGRTGDALIAAADQALYAAKAGGRNQVRGYSSLLESEQGHEPPASQALHGR